MVYILLLILTLLPNSFGFNSFDLNTLFQTVPTFANNTNFFNDCVTFDKIFMVGYNLNVIGTYQWGCEPDEPLITGRLNLKAQGTFAKSDFILPLPIDKPLRFTAALIDDHLHELAISTIFWVNEMWLEADLNTVLELPLHYHHTLKIGLFPYQVGRGIALGYNVPDSQNRFFLLIPFFSIINQYPPGILITGQYTKTISYEIYGTTYQNRSNNFINTSQKVRSPEYGHRFCPQRGFGNIDYLTSFKLVWTPITTETENTHLESYIVFRSKRTFNDQFAAEKFGLVLPDRAENSLVRFSTIGGAGEFVTGQWEFGFDAAHNIGTHFVSGVDNNMIVLATNSGFVQDLNSSVLVAGTPNRAPVTLQNQRIINTSIEQQDQNGKPISPTLVNGPYRFSDPYDVLLRGSMFVADAAYTLIPEKLKVATTVAYASGDADPHVSVTAVQRNDPIRRNNNFISNQELYVGKRVVNAYFLNGASSAPRITDIPSPLSPTPFPVPQIGFINMIFWGAAAHYTPKVCDQQWHINPNLLLYWSQYQTINYAVIPAQKVPRYFGCECNVLAQMPVTENMKWLAALLLFFPGTYYKALENQPLTLDQFNFFNSLDTGQPVNVTALLGADPSFVINIGFEVNF